VVDSIYQLFAALGYSHPIHPPVTHMTIGLTGGALFFALGAQFLHRHNLRVTARHACVLAFIFIFPTVLLGVLDWIHFYNAALIRPIKMKMILAATLFVLLAAGTILGSERRERPVLAIGVYAAAFVCAAGLGYFGGNLVFGSGVVQPSRTGEPGPVSLGSPVPAELQAGGDLFAGNCAACHARGGNVVEPTLPLRDAPQLESFDRFARFVHAPTMPGGKPGPMPSFPASKLGDQELREIYEYIMHMRDQPSWQ
jgi:mono/diheme cytochrome c family protein